jgi:HSP20 family protein
MEQTARADGRTAAGVLHRRLKMAEQTRSEAQAAKSGELIRRPAWGLRPFEDMERAFEEFFGRGWLRPFRFERAPELAQVWEGRLPKLDVIDRDNEVLVRAEVPNVKKEDLEISVTGDLFTIKGQTRREEKEEKGDYYRCEVLQGSFTRTVTLPAMVDETGAKAQLKDGLLEVTLPKTEKSKKRAIKID